MGRVWRRLVARLGPALQSDTAFIESAYREILGREPDLDGLAHYQRLLHEGLGRTAVLLMLTRSEEFTNRLTRSAPEAVSLRALRPDRYRETVDRSNGRPVCVFDAAHPSDFDWLEAAILEHGYYEQPGVWTLGVDVDKRVMAEILAFFEPARALDFGCAAGAVLECLHDRNIKAEGVEISTMAIARASGRIRPVIHQGDLLQLDLPAVYDVVYGLDIFEHLNPNRIDAYLERLTRTMASDAVLFCNIPAFGPDAVFGEVFPLYLDGWATDAAAGRLFSTLHVDDRGYPIHGHLIWASAAWWAERFARQGLRREVEIEQALHRRYDPYMDKRARARKAYFVFSRNAGDARRRRVLDLIRNATPSIG